jgi:hypothetical protein
MLDNFQGSRAQRLIDEFDESETVADGIARVLEHLAYAFDVVCDGEGESLVGVPVGTLDELAVELRNVPDFEPEDPTDEELLELMPQQMRDDLAAAACALAGFDPDNIKAASVFRIILNRHIADHAHAVLARWGS